MSQSRIGSLGGGHVLILINWNQKRILVPSRSLRLILSKSLAAKRWNLCYEYAHILNLSLARLTPTSKAGHGISQGFTTNRFPTKKVDPSTASPLTHGDAFMCRASVQYFCRSVFAPAAGTATALLIFCFLPYVP